MHKLSLLVDPSDHDEVRAVWKLHAHADRCPLSDLFDHFRETQRSRNRIAVKIFRGVQSVLQEAVLVASLGQRIVATVRWSRGLSTDDPALAEVAGEIVALRDATGHCGPTPSVVILTLHHERQRIHHFVPPVAGVVPLVADFFDFSASSAAPTETFRPNENSGHVLLLSLPISWAAVGLLPQPVASGSC